MDLIDFRHMSSDLCSEASIWRIIEVIAYPIAHVHSTVHRDECPDSIQI